jgi:hypothetical protein
MLSFLYNTCSLHQMDRQTERCQVIDKAHLILWSRWAKRVKMLSFLYNTCSHFYPFSSPDKKGLSELYLSLGIPLSVCPSGVNYMYYKRNSAFYQMDRQTERCQVIDKAHLILWSRWAKQVNMLSFLYNKCSLHQMDRQTERCQVIDKAHLILPLSVCPSGVNYMYYKGNSTFLPV